MEVFQQDHTVSCFIVKGTLIKVRCTCVGIGGYFFIEIDLPSVNTVIRELLPCIRIGMRNLSYDGFWGAFFEHRICQFDTKNPSVESLPFTYTFAANGCDWIRVYDAGCAQNMGEPFWGHAFQISWDLHCRILTRFLLELSHYY